MRVVSETNRKGLKNPNSELEEAQKKRAKGSFGFIISDLILHMKCRRLFLWKHSSCNHQNLKSLCAKNVIPAKNQLLSFTRTFYTQGEFNNFVWSRFVFLSDFFKVSSLLNYELCVMYQIQTKSLLYCYSSRSLTKGLQTWSTCQSICCPNAYGCK